MPRFGLPRRRPLQQQENPATMEARDRRIKAALAADVTARVRTNRDRIQKIPESSRPGWKNSRQPYSKEASRSMSITATALQAAAAVTPDNSVQTPVPAPASTDAI